MWKVEEIWINLVFSYQEFICLLMKPNLTQISLMWKYLWGKIKIVNCPVPEINVMMEPYYPSLPSNKRGAALGLESLVLGSPFCLKTRIQLWENRYYTLILARRLCRGLILWPLNFRALIYPLPFEHDLCNGKLVL